MYNRNRADIAEVVRQEPSEAPVSSVVRGKTCSDRCRAGDVPVLVTASIAALVASLRPASHACSPRFGA